MKTKQLFTKEKIIATIKEYKILGILTSIAIMLVGVLMMIFPTFSTFAYVIIFIVGLILAGAFGIYRYSRDKKNGFNHVYLLINGVINLLLAVMLTISLITNAIMIGAITGESFTNSLLFAITDLFYWVLMFYAFASLFRGIFRLSNLRQDSDTLKWYEITTAIIQIIFAVALIILSLLPDATIMLIIMIVLGFYVFLRGIILFIDTLISHHHQVSKHDKIIDESDVIDNDIDSKA